jgi:hypothetical protein
MGVSIEKLRKKYLRASGEAKCFWQAYKRAAEYAAPSIQTFDKNPGGNNSPNVRTSQALRSTNAFICEFISSLTPPHRRWAELRPTSHLIESIAAASGVDTYEDVEKKLSDSYQRITGKFFECLDASNFYDVLKQFVLSIGIGTGCVLVNELDWGPDSGNAVPFEFIHIPVSNLSIDAGNNNRIYGVFRDICARREEIPLLWPDATLDQLEEHDDYQLVECCAYDPDGNRTLPWCYCVFHGNDGVKVVEDRRLAYNPFIVFRWSVVDGESLGRGPILAAMADINSLNSLWETYFEWIDRNALGLTLVQNSEYSHANLDDYLGSRLRPGNFLPVSNPGNFVPLRVSGDMSAAQFCMAEFVSAVRQQLLDIELPTQNTMIAYETRERSNRILRLMAGLVGRINLGFIRSFFDIGLRLLVRNGIVAVPEEIGNINEFTTKIVLQSPLAHMQQMEDIEATRMALETLNLMQTPGASQFINMEKFVEFVWLNSGAPAKLLNTKEEVRQVRQAEMQNQVTLEQAKRFDMNKLQEEAQGIGG